MLARPRFLVDSHTHCFPDRLAPRAIESVSSQYGVQPESDGTLAGTLAAMDQDGVAVSLVLPVASRPEQVRSINDWAASIRSERIVPLGSVHPAVEDPGGEIERIISLGLPGIKLQPTWGGFYPDEAALDPIHQACRGRLIVYFHAGNEIRPISHVYSTPRRIARVLDRFPGLTVVAAHLGGYLMWEEVEECLLGRELYLDMCYCPPEVLPDARMLALIRRHGVERVLFGSDFPFGRPARDLERLQRLGLTQEELELICWRNASRLLGLKLEG